MFKSLSRLFGPQAELPGACRWQLWQLLSTSDRLGLELLIRWPSCTAWEVHRGVPSFAHQTCVSPRGVVHTALNSSPQPLVRGPVLAVDVPAEACVDKVHLRWDKFVLTLCDHPQSVYGCPLDRTEASQAVASRHTYSKYWCTSIDP